MTTLTKRAIAFAAAAGLGLGISAMAAPNAFAAPIPTEFRNDTGVAGTMPQYDALEAGDRSMTSYGSLYTQTGEPLASRTIVIYNYTNGARGATLGSGTTNASGVFQFSSSLPAGWSTDPAFNVELVFEDATGEYGPSYGIMKPVAVETDDDTPITTPITNPSTTPTAKNHDKNKNKHTKTTKAPVKKHTKATKAPVKKHTAKKAHKGGLAKTGVSA